ncbi:MAG: hypothetical protein AB8H86_26145 [Polyangiales bacterium]
MNYRLRALFFAVSLTVSFGCGDDSTPSTCTPGASVACVGAGGCAGGQVCNADGTAFGECMCGGADTGPSGSDADTPDSGPMDAARPDVTADVGPRPPVDAVDILFAIDNSGSMSEEQASLVAELPAFINGLASGQTPGGGTTFAPVTDLRVGVVSSDLGTGGFTIPTCDEPNFGDDGILSRATNGAGCTDIPGGEPPFLALQPGGDVDDFTDAAACLLSLGTQGCGFEQQLDAMLKSVTSETAATTFVNGSRGHGDVANEGFAREDSLLVVVMLTDEDDCSAANPDIYNRDSATFTDPDLNLRCSRYEDAALHPVERYVDGLLAVHPPERLLFHVVSGIPVDLVPPPGVSPDYDALVGPEAGRDPRMVNTPDPVMPSQLTASCDVPGRGRAYPPVRIVRVAEGLQAAGAGVILQSICQSEFGFAAALSTRIARYREI